MAEAEDLSGRFILDLNEDQDLATSETQENVAAEAHFDRNAEEIPSKVTDKDYIYMPKSFENFEEREEWKSSGKWLVFSHGDIQKLDYWWTQLQPLLANETLVCIKSSTATDPSKGILMCYTLNCEDKIAVKTAADAIRKVVEIEYLIYYKTNAASDSGLYQMHGDKQITKYMHSVACSLYERDENKRWKKVSFQSNDRDLN